MRYTEIIVYTRWPGEDIVTASRVTKANGYTSVKNMPIDEMYRGHCQWIAEQINPNQARRAA